VVVHLKIKRGREAIMKPGLVVSLAAALALMIFIPTGAEAVGVGKQCDGFPGLQCDAGLFCQKKPGTCAVIDMSGICVRVPRFCPRVTGPTIQVCGCNGETYINDCEREKAMVSLTHRGKCQ
jgi:hypothetical protein